MNFLTMIYNLFLIFAIIILKLNTKNFPKYSEANKVQKIILGLKAFFISAFSHFKLLILVFITFISFNYNLWVVLIIFLIFIIINLIIKKIRQIVAFKKLNYSYKYIRELPKDSSVCEISFLNKRNMNLKKDIKLTILNLYAKGFIDLVKTEDNKVKFFKKNLEIPTKSSEFYIYDYLFSENKNDFSINKWKDAIEEELLYEEIITQKKILSTTLIFFLTYSAIFLTFAITYFLSVYKYNIEHEQDFVQAFLVSGLLIIPTYLYEKINKQINKELSKKGWAKKYLVNSFKNFLKDFSNIKEIQLEQYPLWREYLIFAQVLNLNVNYKKFPNIKMNILSSKEIKTLLENYIEELTYQNEE